MVAAALATTLIAASCGGGDQGNENGGVATLVGADSSGLDTLITTAATPEATTSESEAVTIPAATAGQGNEAEGGVGGGDVAGGGVSENVVVEEVPPASEEVGHAPEEVEPEEPETDPEQALLKFAQCMRENGLPDFVDPTVDATGTVQWNQMFANSGIDPASDEFQQGLDVCRHHFEGLAFGGDGGGFNITEVQDTLLGFAQCLRVEGIQVDDPVLARLVTGTGDNPGTRLFGPAFDPTNPDVQAAVEACREELGGLGGGGTQAGGQS